MTNEVIRTLIAKPIEEKDYEVHLEREYKGIEGIIGIEKWTEVFSREIGRRIVLNVDCKLNEFDKLVINGVVIKKDDLDKLSKK